jgi:hypothetical protein
MKEEFDVAVVVDAVVFDVVVVVSEVGDVEAAVCLRVSGRYE